MPLHLSFQRKLESRPSPFMDPRLRGDKPGFWALAGMTENALCAYHSLSLILYIKPLEVFFEALSHLMMLKPGLHNRLQKP